MMELYHIECHEMYEFDSWDSRWLAEERMAQAFILSISERFGFSQFTLSHYDLFPGFSHKEILVALMNTEASERTTQLLQRWVINVTKQELQKVLHFEIVESPLVTTAEDIEDV